MGAHCKAVGPTRFACRYVESEKALAAFCWHVAIEGNGEKAIQRVDIALAALGV